MTSCLPRSWKPEALLTDGADDPLRVLDRTLMRVGNDEYTRQNQSYGLTTLLTEHIESKGSRIRFSFRGKSGKTFEAELSDRRVRAVLSLRVSVAATAT
ncbi:MAG: hypothetical protein ACR2J1_08385 [Methyloceanibacter sp.]|uniref:hypothetical protein n=1 Tax=Methyloceanibacter sp. TaxID=1965321 RepID=UPI003D9B9F09